MNIEAEVPRQTSTLRIDLPPFSNVVISEFNLTINGKNVSISDDWFEYSNIATEQEVIKAGGFEDPYFVLNISRADKFMTGRFMWVKFRFKLHVDDLFGNRRFIHHRAALD